MKNGFIKQPRSIEDWQWYKSSETVHLFFHLVRKANPFPKEWKGIEINRGQLVTGRKVLSEQTGLSERTIRTCLKRLKSTSNLTIKTTNKYSIITILDYDSYNGDHRENDQQNDQQPVQQTTSKNAKSDHNGEYIENNENNENIKHTYKEFENPNFKAAWNKWIHYRSEKGNPLTATEEETVLKKLYIESDKKSVHAIYTINYCISQGWKSLHKPKSPEEKRERRVKMPL